MFSLQKEIRIKCCWFTEFNKEREDKLVISSVTRAFTELRLM